ncbi:MAG: nicotinamide riboside transporter PnuC [Oscillospiraceae bacterium]|nr:nicotinamide riboside transporter PnuC [Oscillospiraceae bacterium]
MLNKVMENFKKWKAIDFFWIALTTIIMILASIILWDKTDNKISMLSLIGTVMGMINVILVAKREVYMNIITAIIGEIAMGICYLHWNLLGNAVLNLAIFLPSNFAFIYWLKREKNNIVPTFRLNNKKRIILVIVTLAITLLLGLIFANINTSTPFIGDFLNADFYGGNNPMPYIDAFTLIANIIALVLMYLLYTEQWYLWVIVDVATLIIWIITATKSGSSSAIAYCVMYACWLINAVYGIKNWRKNQQIK